MEEQKLLDFISGEAPESDRKEVLEWINSSPKNKSEYRIYRRLFDITVWNEPAKKAGKSHILRKSIIAAGAAASLVLIGGHIFHNVEKVAPQTIPLYLKSVTAPYGRELNLQLADGSEVWLNAGSSLNVTDSGPEGCRTVRLEGEGYFKVAHDPAHPFIVQTSKLDIKVLGTEFNVISDTGTGKWETALFNGSISIMDKNFKEILTIAPGTHIAMEDGRLLAETLDPGKYLWKDGILYFDNKPLKEIFEELSNYYNTDFKYSNSAVTDKRYTGKFRSVDGLEHILNVLKVDKEFSYRAVNDTGNHYILIY